MKYAELYDHIQNAMDELVLAYDVMKEELPETDSNLDTIRIAYLSLRDLQQRLIITAQKEQKGGKDEVQG